MGKSLASRPILAEPLTHTYRRHSYDPTKTDKKHWRYLANVSILDDFEQVVSPYRRVIRLTVYKQRNGEQRNWIRLSEVMKRYENIFNDLKRLEDIANREYIQLYRFKWAILLQVKFKDKELIHHLNDSFVYLSDDRLLNTVKLPDAVIHGHAHRAIDAHKSPPREVVRWIRYRNDLIRVRLVARLIDALSMRVRAIQRQCG